MIYLYTGTPGSGKSLHLAKQIKSLLEFGYPIISNIEIKTELIRHCKGQYVQLKNEEITPEFLKYYSRQYFKGKKVREGLINLIFDESQMVFNARDWNKPDRRGWLDFFTVHRHFGYDILLVAQFDDMLDKQVRALVEYQWVHRKIKNMGWRGKLFNALSGGKLFSCSLYWYPMKDSCGVKFVKARKKYYSLYNTFADFGETEQEELTDALKKAIEVYERVCISSVQENTSVQIQLPSTTVADTHAPSWGVDTAALGSRILKVKQFIGSIFSTKAFFYVILMVAFLLAATISFSVCNAILNFF